MGWKEGVRNELLTFKRRPLIKSLSGGGWWSRVVEGGRRCLAMVGDGWRRLATVRPGGMRRGQCFAESEEI